MSLRRGLGNWRRDDLRRAVKLIQQLQEENESLKKCYEITNESWREIKEENEKLKQQLEVK